MSEKTVPYYPLTEDERQESHGNWEETSLLARTLKDTAAGFHRNKLTPSQREALDAILGKIARICCGNPQERDHWIDIAGYARLGSRGIGK